MFEQFKEPDDIMVAERVAKGSIDVAIRIRNLQKALFYVSHLQFDDSVEKALIPWNLFTSALGLASYRNKNSPKLVHCPKNHWRNRSTKQVALSSGA